MSSSQKNNTLGRAVPGDAGPSSGAKASDASRVITPGSQGKMSSGAHSSSTYRNESERYRLANHTPPISAPASSSKIRRHHSARDSPANPETIASQSSSASRSRNFLANATPVTPSKGSAPPSSTPSSRLAIIENTLNSLRLESPSPTTSKLTRSATVPQIGPSPARLVVIKDSDSEPDSDDALTDHEGPATMGRPPLTTDSSKSSMNSLFSQTTGVSSASSLDLAPPQSTTQPPAKYAKPTVSRDVFNDPLSPNVTTRKKPRAGPRTPVTVPAASQSPVTPQEPVPLSIPKFAHSGFGVDLEVGYIAHDDGTQKLMDTLEIEWGTQYELARGVSQGWWSWADVHGRLDQLKGRNADVAFKVHSIMQHKRTGTTAPSDINLWKELDREQLAIMENLGRGLGLMGDWEGSTNWYGGQIQQLARLVKEGSTYKMKLEPMEKRRSHRYARMFGSRRFIHLKITKEVLQNENAQVKRFLLKKFILCGRTYVPFFSKEKAVYLVETNDNYNRSIQEWAGDRFRVSFQDFINWHNPLEEPKNYKQNISKWSTRFALGLSNSVPALEFDERNIEFIADITTPNCRDKAKPAAEELMTDGCGFINHAALYRIVKYMGYENMPAGIQGRIDGSKGFWILHPTDNSLEPKIWIRNSQHKIKNRSPDRAHRILDLLGPSRPSPSIALTSQSIVNVFSNGISSETLVRMMEEGLEKEVAPLLDWDRPHASVFLWDAVNKAGNVTGSRTQRVATALNRALGLKGRDWGPEESDTEAEDEDAEDAAASANAGRNKYSGSPASLYELSLEMLQSGFLPSSSDQLFKKMGYIVDNVIKASVEKFRIPIEESLGAYVVPDPLGVLEPGEIYYRFSRPRTDPKTGLLVHTLEGDVLLGRYPIRLPSDMRKVRAVDRRELDKWPDVIIISTKGDRSLANWLAGGDMDGDELIAIWDQIIVQAFHNTSLTQEPAGLLDRDFEPTGKVEKVESFCNRVQTMSSRQASEAILEHLIANLNESQVGLYSMMHENATVVHGYDHANSIRLAYIFAILLDASKTGHRLKAGVLRKDLDRFGKKSDNSASLHSRDILGSLKIAGTQKGRELLQRYESKKGPIPQDKELLQPYNTASNYALAAYKRNVNIFNEELDKIRAHVKAAHHIFQESCKEYRDKKSQGLPSKLGKKGKASSNDLMIPCARAYAQPLQHEIILTRDLEQVKASYAYQLSEAFAFSVAFNELCHMKAVAASGGHAPNLRIFDEAKTFSSAFLRALTRLDED